MIFDVEHIAKLARIGLSEGEKEKFAKELAAILEFVEKLKEVDVKDVVPTSQATGLQSVMRADEAIKKDKKEQGVILANTPESKDGYIKVKAVFE